MRLTFCIQLPLEDEKHEYKGTMTMYQSKRPKVLPRIGERIYLLPELSPMVADIIHMGENQYFIKVILEPASEVFRNQLEAKSPLSKSTRWEWTNEREL